MVKNLNSLLENLKADQLSPPEQKKILRKYFLQLREVKRKQSDPSCWGPKQFEKALHLLKLPNLTSIAEDYKIGCYFPIRGELDLAQFAKSDWLFPKIEAKSKELLWFKYGKGQQECDLGKHGIPEKQETQCRPLEAYNKPMICFVPGLAASITGYRIGYGGGFYDKFLNAQKDKVTSVLCLPSEEFILDSLPIEEHDRKIDLIVF